MQNKIEALAVTINWVLLYLLLTSHLCMPLEVERNGQRKQMDRFIITSSEKCQDFDAYEIEEGYCECYDDEYMTSMQTQFPKCTKISGW